MVKTIVILEFLVWGLVLLTLVTQVAWPVLRGRPMFPLLHRRGRELESALAKAQDARDMHDMASRIEETARYGRPPMEPREEAPKRQSTNKPRPRSF